MIFKNIIDCIGNTPLLNYKTNETKAEIYIKLESYNPTGSIKDRACIYNIKNAINEKKLTKNKVILDASSGNMACAIAFYGHILGYKTKVVCGSKLTDDKKKFIEYFDAELMMKGDFTIEANKYCRELSKKNENYCFLDQLHNFNNPKASYETLGPEIYDLIPNIKAIVGSLGSGGSMLGTSKFLKSKNKEIISIAVESDSGTKLPGTGSFIDGDYITPFISEGIDNKIFDIHTRINLEQAIKRTTELKKQGVFCGFQTGAVLQGLIQECNINNISGPVVMISGDSGWKNVDKLMG